MIDWQVVAYELGEQVDTLKAQLASAEAHRKGTVAAIPEIVARSIEAEQRKVIALTAAAIELRGALLRGEKFQKALDRLTLALAEHGR